MTTSLIHFSYTPTDSPVCGDYANSTTTTDASTVTCGSCRAVCVDNARVWARTPGVGDSWTYAECPDDGHRYVLATDGGADRVLFVCSGHPADDMRTLALADVYLEHDERGGVDSDGALIIVTVPVCSWCDDVATHNLTTDTEQACDAHHAVYATDPAWAALDTFEGRMRAWGYSVGAREATDGVPYGREWRNSDGSLIAWTTSFLPFPAGYRAGFASVHGVTVAWHGRTRTAVIVGEEYPDGLPTGARFLPVRFTDDDTTHNVDTRVITRTV